MKSLRRRMSRKWLAVDRIFVGEMPLEKRKIALRAITFPGRVMADNRYRDCEGNGCPLIIAAEAVKGGTIENSEREMAKVLGINTESASFFIQIWDGAEDDERKGFLQRMSAHLELISPSDHTADPMPLFAQDYPVFRTRGYGKLKRR